MKQRSLLTLMLIAVLFFAFIGLSTAQASNDNDEPKTIQIRMQQLVFIPSEVEINVGDTVVWRNLQTDPQRVFTLVSEDGLWESTSVTYRRTMTYTFNETGTYDFYVREFPARMSGTITVNPRYNEPTARFTASPSEGEVPLEVTFSDESEYAFEHYWEFGDGETSDEREPTHIYNEPGTYDVILTVANDVGEDKTARPIIVRALPENPKAKFTANPSEGEVPLEVTFSDESENAFEYYWEFGDGATSDEREPTHIYNEPGTYDVTLTVTNDVGEDTFIQSITVIDPEDTIPGFGAALLIISIIIATYLVTRKD
ncbi:PKD domain-containing protein [Methanosalsum natronophilum]|uniref:PKD domain-containing protein n=1 Tax=Methanosalsum natronophilum TaxID=768733 RepID=A0A3R7WFL6_9EURY|nr:PKD domain-containing protein [Methanosalsum natronophilum]MCS3924882.1 PKD repeat protein [Methanosalsum natronophilum]RQD91871.1 MAG: PKD domain-containing protein [Methanosalsum natronophilum]